MTTEEQCSYDNIDDLDDPENFTEGTQTSTNINITPEKINENEEISTANHGVTERTVESRSLYQLPLSRVKNIMKLDPDLNVVSLETVFIVAKATELFVQSLAREAYIHTQQNDKKTVQKKDLDAAINSVDALHFLEDTLV